MLAKQVEETENLEIQVSQLQDKLKEKDLLLTKHDHELKDLKSKRDTLRKEMEDRMRSEETKHEKELEKLRLELSRLQQQSKNSFI